MEKVACSHCDGLFNKTPLKEDEVAKCPRCETTLYYENLSFSNAIALIIVSFFLYPVAMLFPFVELGIVGQKTIISVFEGIQVISHEKNSIYLAVIVALLVMVFPLARLAGLLLILLPIQLGKRQILSRGLIRLTLNIGTWSMIEVYLIGCIVTMVKLFDLGHMSLETGFYVFFVLVIFNALIIFSTPRQRIWQAIHESQYQC